ncbi:MAG TPA: glycosyltransferase family 2 protein [bacterium]
MAKKKCLAIIPAYNEEANVGAVIRKVKAQPSVHAVLVVDDCSADGTAEKARKAGAIVVTHVANLGYGAAVETGYKYALERDYDRVVQLDGDGQHEPACIKDLLRALERGQADVVIGSRFLGGHGRYKTPLLRKIGMGFFRLLVRLMTRLTITDPTSGFQAMDRRVIRFLIQNRLYPSDYPDADIIMLLHNVGFKIAEVPATFYSSTTGQSMHSGLKPLYYVIKMLLSIFTVQFGQFRTFFRRKKTCPPCP